MISRVTVLAVAIFLAASSSHAQSLDGKTLFGQRCAACHSLSAAGPSITAPHLARIAGRKAGTVEGFRYSKALANSGIVWDEAKIDQYLSSPGRMVPGTRMAVSISDPKQRRAIAKFLVKQR